MAHRRYRLGAAIGLAASGDADELIALRPDCVVYAASGPERDAVAVKDYLRLLEAGINVVTTTSTRLAYPPTFDPTWRDQLARTFGRHSISPWCGTEPRAAPTVNYSVEPR